MNRLRCSLLSQEREATGNGLLRNFQQRSATATLMLDFSATGFAISVAGDRSVAGQPKQASWQRQQPGMM